MASSPQHVAYLCLSPPFLVLILHKKKSVFMKVEFFVQGSWIAQGAAYI